MSRERDKTDIVGNIRYVYLFCCAVMFLALDVYEGFGTVNVTEHKNWVDSLIVLGFLVGLELYGANYQAREARAKESLKYWMETAIQRQVEIDRLKHQK